MLYTLLGCIQSSDGWKRLNNFGALREREREREREVREHTDQGMYNDCQWDRASRACFPAKPLTPQCKQWQSVTIRQEAVTLTG